MAKQRDLSALVDLKAKKDKAEALSRQDANVSRHIEAEVKRKHFRISKQLARRFSILAVEQDRTETDLIHEAIQDLLDKHEGTE